MAKKVLAVTACPVGIAHTYMAAENLQKAAEELGVAIKVETQGSIGVENELTAKDIEEAEAIIIASDKEVSKERFAGKKLLVTGVQDGIRRPKELIQQAQSENVPVYQGGGFLFGAAMIAEGNFEIMGPIAVAICIPPIGMGLATFLSRKKYLPAEREAGKASFTMGLFGITEGAIPFAAQDPFRVIPSIVVGSMVGAVIAMLSDVGDRVAHGGPIVAVLGAVDNVLMFFVAAIIGAIVTALMVNVLKKDVYEEAVYINDKEPKPVKTGAEIGQPKSETAPKEIHKLTDITNLNLIEPNLAGTSQAEVIDEMIAKLAHENVISSTEPFKQAILAREKQSTTGIGMNIAIPHGKSPAVKRPAVVFGIKRDGVDWNSLDGTAAKLIFMIAVPEESAGDAHLKILQMLSRRLMDDQFREQLLQVNTKKEAYQLLDTIQ